MKRWVAIDASCVAVIVLLTGRAAHAEGTSELEGLLDQPIVVAASKTAETESAAPGTATVLTSDDLRRYGIHTIAEAIDFLSLGAATSTGPAGTEVGARGVLLSGDHNDHVLLLVNGHPVNEPLFGGANFDRAAGIPMEIVDHIEVILGPGSVLYGTGAMLGVVNVVTRHAQSYQGLHLVGETDLLHSVRAGAGAGYEFNLLGAQSELTAAVEYFTKSGPDLAFPVRPFDRNPGGTWGGTASQSNTSEVSSAILRLKSGNLEVNLRGSIDRVGNLNPILLFDHPMNRTLERWGSVDISYRIPISPIVDLTTRVYGDAAERQHHEITGTFFGCAADSCDFTTPGVAHSAGAEARTSLDWLTSGRFVTLLGVDARLRFVAYKFDHVSPLTNAPLENTVSNFQETDVPVGAYAQQTWQPAQWLSFNGGLRFDKDPRFSGVFSPRIAATVVPWTGGAFKAIYSEAFRAPSWIETNSSGPVQLVADESVDGVHGVRHLEPEKVRMYELSVDQTLGSQRIRFGAFLYEWKNLVGLHQFGDAELRATAAAGVLGDIPYSPDLIVTQYRNIQSVNDYGFNLGYEGSLLAGNLRYGASVTATIARDTNELTLPVAAQAFGNARISYDLGGGLPVVSLAARFQGRRVVDIAYTGGFAPTPRTTPVLELRATLAGPVPVVKGLSYRATSAYAFQSFEPYGVGPVQTTASGQQQPDLLPNPSGAFVETLGLQYDF
jgi:outer membrane receptor for ferrienterochelin and colicins